MSIHLGVKKIRYVTSRILLDQFLMRQVYTFKINVNGVNDNYVSSKSNTIL